MKLMAQHDPVSSDGCVTLVTCSRPTVRRKSANPYGSYFVRVGQRNDLSWCVNRRYVRFRPNMNLLPLLMGQIAATATNPFAHELWIFTEVT